VRLFHCRIGCKRVWSCLTQSATTSGLLIRQLFCFSTRKISSRRRSGNRLSPSASKNTQAWTISDLFQPSLVQTNLHIFSTWIWVPLSRTVQFVVRWSIFWASWVIRILLKLLKSALYALNLVVFKINKSNNVSAVFVANYECFVSLTVIWLYIVTEKW